jgi:Zn-dependent protease
MPFVTLLFSNPLLYIQTILIVIISIVIHELAHGWAAMSYGDNTPVRAGHMTLNPVTHMGQASLVMLCLTGIAWGTMPVNPAKFRSLKWGNIIVSLAGPFANLAIALFLANVIKFFLISDSASLTFYLPFYNLMFYAALTNMMLFLFNLLPVPPLDGFHAVSEFFPGLKAYQNSPYSLFILMLLFTTGIGNGLSITASFLLGIAL